MNLSDMTVTQLREIAADLDIFGRSKMKKADLIAAIEFAEAPSVDNIPGGVDTFADTFDHSAAVAKLRANREAEEEERAVARRARNRTNYAPAPAPKSDDVADSVSAMIEQDAPNRIRFNAPPVQQRPRAAVNEVAILRDAPGRAIVTAAFDGQTVGGEIKREGNRWVLRCGIIRLRANSLEKLAKLFAAQLGFRADVIDVARIF